MDTIIAYLKQASTWRGIVSLVVALGLWRISPEAQDSIVQTALLVVAAGEGLKGTINVVQNEKKK